MPVAVIFDIERSAMHDGPGIRTVVFFKGCPLRCRWCHNPESQAFAPQEMYYPDKCIGCGRCAEGCYTGARQPCGQDMTIEQVMAPVLADKPYYGVEGGVTLSGGEPQCQPEFLNELVDACRAEGIHTAIETSMAVYHPEILQKLDLIMADVKLWDDRLHQQYVGVSNRPILEHIRRADGLGVPILIRTPVIPGVNDTQEEITAIRDFARSLQNVVGYELLPYHPFGEDKWQALGQEPVRFSVPTTEQMQALRACAVLNK